MERSERLARLALIPTALAIAFFLLRDSGSGADGAAGQEQLGRTTTSAAVITAESPETTVEGATSTTAAEDEPPTTTSTTVAAASGDGTPAGGSGGLPAADPDAPPTDPVATWRDGTVVLTGSVPDEALAAGFAERIGDAFGVEVAVAMTVDERVTADRLDVVVEPTFPLPLGSTDLGATFEPLLELASAALDGLPEATLLVTGHTSASDDVASAAALSRASAQLVVSWLVERGLPADRVEVEGAGQSRPVADNATPEGEQANRRIEVALRGVTPR